MITLLASVFDPDAYNESWDVAAYAPLYLLGLIAAAVYVVSGIVRWFWSGNASFWWSYTRRVRVQRPRRYD